MGAAIVFGDHYGVTSPAFEDTIKVGGSNATDKNIFDTNYKHYIVLDSLSGPSNTISFWSGYSVSNMLPFSQSVYALAAYNDYGITDTIALEEKMLDSLEIAGLGKVILFDSLVVTSLNNFHLLSLNVFPNPSQSVVTIQHQNISGLSQISVFDISGKMIYNTQQNVTNNMVSFPVNQFANGQCLVLLQSKNVFYQSKFTKGVI